MKWNSELHCIPGPWYQQLRNLVPNRHVHLKNLLDKQIQIFCNPYQRHRSLTPSSQEGVWQCLKIFRVFSSCRVWSSVDLMLLFLNKPWCCWFPRYVRCMVEHDAGQSCKAACKKTRGSGFQIRDGFEKEGKDWWVYPKAIRCATSRACQCSSGLKYVCTSIAFMRRNAKHSLHTHFSSQAARRWWWWYPFTLRVLVTSFPSSSSCFCSFPISWPPWTTAVRRRIIIIIIIAHQLILLEAEPIAPFQVLLRLDVAVTHDYCRTCFADPGLLHHLGEEEELRSFSVESLYNTWCPISLRQSR